MRGARRRLRAAAGGRVFGRPNRGRRHRHKGLGRTALPDHVARHCRTILVSNEGEPSGYGDPSQYVDPEVCAALCCAVLCCAVLCWAGLGSCDASQRVDPEASFGWAALWHAVCAAHRGRFAAPATRPLPGAAPQRWPATGAGASNTPSPPLRRAPYPSSG